MGREKDTSQPTLQQSESELEGVLSSLRSISVVTGKRCVCGYAALSSYDLNMHRESCQILKCAIVGDIIRVANQLDKTPTHAEYLEAKSKHLPPWSVINATVFDSWNDAVAEARLPITRKTKQ